MATTGMSCANLTEFCQQCNDGVLEFGRTDLIITACIAYVGGLISVLFVVVAIKLKREKKLCFQEPVEPFRGKWEGASQKATIQVLKKHTLEKSLSGNKSKSMEASREANNSNDDVNNSIKSDEQLLTVNVTDENNDKPVLTVINVGDMNETKTHETNSSNQQLEQSIKESTLSDKGLHQDEESKQNAIDILNVEPTASLDDTDIQKDHVDAAAVEDSDDAPDNAETTLDDTQSKTIKETNIESSLKSDNDKSPVLKSEDTSVDKAGRSTLACGSEDKTVELKDENHHKSHVIVRDSSGAELFEEGRESIAFDPDELILQNDNFRISQLSFN